MDQTSLTYSTPPAAPAQLPGVGELLSISLHETKSRYLQMLGLSALPTAASILAILVGVLLYWSTKSTIVVVVYGIVTLITLIVLGLCAQVGNITAALVSPRSKTFAALLSNGRKHAGSLFAVSFIYSIGVAVGFMLLVFPGIWLALRYGMAFFIVVDENVGAREALKRSVVLTKGHLRALFVRILVYAFVYIILAGIAGYFWHMANIGGGVTGQNFNPVSIINLFLAPWYIVYAAVLYRSLQILASQKPPTTNA